MRKLKFIVLSLGLLTFASCEKNDDVNSETPSQEAEMKYSFGAKFVDESTYDAFEKVDINALSLKYKGKDAVTAKKILPSSYSIPGSVPGDQGQEGSCVAWATAYAAESLLEYNFRGVTQPRSPEYVYNQIKLNADCKNAGSYVNKGLDLLKKQGVCSMLEMPYNDTECATQPNTAQKTAASSHKITSWGTVNKTDIAGIKNLLTMNIPVVTGLLLKESFKNIKNTGWLLSTNTGTVLGGHAVCVVGYDDSKQAFKVQNSWNTTWGDNGYFWISYSLFSKNVNQFSGTGVVLEAYAAYVQ